MKKTQSQKLQSLQQHLKSKQTYPLITRTIILHLSKGPDETFQQMEEENNHIAPLIKRAIEENMHLIQK